jgi:hypothetical protein
MDCGLGIIDGIDILERIKSSNQTDYQKITEYKKYLLDDKSYRFPDMFLEFIARERLDLKFTEEEIATMREQSNLSQQRIKEEDAIPI